MSVLGCERFRLMESMRFGLYAFWFVSVFVCMRFYLVPKSLMKCVSTVFQCKYISSVILGSVPKRHKCQLINWILGRSAIVINVDELVL